MFKRKIYQRLLDWKKKKQGTTALLIEGARRVGKTTIVQAFGEKEYRSYILLDFSNISPMIKALFLDMSDLNYFFLQLKLLTHTPLYERDSLIIFDEIQLFPLARQAIKHLVKDHRYDYIETGSLISIKKNVADILIPSEETKISMHPMDYEEFLWAVGENETPGSLKEMLKNGKPIGEKTNYALMKKFRLYMLIGGMPNAVDTYIKKNDFEAVDSVKREIIDLYENDFKRIDPSGRLGLIFEAIPSQLNKNKSFFQIQSVIKTYNQTDATLLRLIGEVKDSQTVNIAYQVRNLEADLSSYKDLNKYKIYLNDTGLFITMMFKDRPFLENNLYERLLSDKCPINLGYLYENALAQILTANGKELFYYTFYNPTQKRNYEVDFLIREQNKISAIEVKSSSYRKHASLDQLASKFPRRLAHQYVVHTKDFVKGKDITYLPIYLAPFFF